MPLQEGIYVDVGARPGSAWGALFLRVRPGVGAEQVNSILIGLSEIYAGLRQGRISDLPGVLLPTMDLTILYAYGPKAFALPGARRSLPLGLASKFQFAPPVAAGGGPLLAGSGLAYAQGLARNPATEDVLVQAIANSPLAVARVFVETQKYLDDHPDPETGQPLVELAAGYTGFNREDGRSWIDFHDGVSNLRSGAQRQGVVSIKKAGTPVADRWTVDGAYLAFIRLSVDLGRWRALPLNAQQLAVGRMKVSGCAIESVNAAGDPVAVGGCPFTGTGSILDPGNEAFREPPTVGDATVLDSHVQRANHHLGPTERDVSQRIFRQGYEFLDPPGPGRALQQGLNFVSFQDTLKRLFSILTLQGWLGGVNFGGASDSLNQPLLQVLAAGVFLCPPTSEGENYPGQSIFTAIA